jgi:hypothetical protein
VNRPDLRDDHDTEFTSNAVRLADVAEPYDQRVILRRTA